MKSSPAALRLLLVFLTSTAFSAPSFSAPPRPPTWEEATVSWQQYVGSCQRLEREVAAIRSGQASSAQDAAFRIRPWLEIMQGNLAGTTQDVIHPGQLARCQAIANEAQALQAQSESDARGEEMAQSEQNQRTHLNSPEYKRAAALGYRDVAGISFLKMYQDMDGEASMKSLMITVDEECGRHFRATQYVQPYVIYTVQASNGGCGEKKRVAILRSGGEPVELGDWIEQDAYYEYLGWKKLVGANGFPTEVRTLRQRR